MPDDVAAYQADLREPISQGDIFDELRFAWVNLATDEPPYITETHSGMMLSYRFCEYDKARVRYVDDVSVSARLPISTKASRSETPGVEECAASSTYPD